MARPKGVPINHRALTDFMACRHRSLSEVAVEADLSVSYLSELTNGVGKPSKPALKRIADALRVSPASLERFFIASDIGSLLTVETLTSRCDEDDLEELRRLVDKALEKKKRQGVAA